MNEHKFIRKMQQDKPNSHTSIGDDAALYKEVLITKDAMIEGIHFLSSTPIDHVIKKLYTSNISDIASMGGVADACVLGVSVPVGYDLLSLADSLLKYSEYYDIKIIGGDTTASKNGVFLSMTIFGKQGDNLLTRCGAKVGDKICVSRKLGSARLSLENELGTHVHQIDKYAHYMMDAEIELGKLLGNTVGVTSCIDISDGLGLDSSHIATSSGCKLVIDEELLRQATDVNIEYAVSSGEEYALLFTARDEVIEQVRSLYGHPIYCIGDIAEGGGVYLESDGKLIDISHKGYEHKFI